MPTQQKKELVAKLAERLERAEAVYFTNYQGLSHQELENLRRKIKEQDADYTIVKNTLLQIALKQSEFSIFNFQFSISGPTAILFAYQDPIKPLQNFTTIFKDRLKAAIAYGEYITGEKLQRLVDLEPEEELHTKLVTQLVSPMYGLAYALNWNIQRLAIVIGKIQSSKSKTQNKFKN